MLASLVVNIEEADPVFTDFGAFDDFVDLGDLELFASTLRRVDFGALLLPESLLEPLLLPEPLPPLPALPGCNTRRADLGALLLPESLLESLLLPEPLLPLPGCNILLSSSNCIWIVACDWIPFNPVFLFL